MPRLTRQPCEKCATDTLHTGIVCNICGSHLDIMRHQRRKDANVRFHTKVYRGNAKARALAKAVTAGRRSERQNTPSNYGERTEGPHGHGHGSSLTKI